MRKCYENDEDATDKNTDLCVFVSLDINKPV